MHKIFAKTEFLGKNVISLPDCHSTNDLLMDYAKLGQAREGTIVMSDYQSVGKGQRGNQWESQRGENLLFSLLLEPQFIEPKDQFYLSFGMALATVKAIESLAGDQQRLQVKWPNDIYFNDKKLAGILLESSLLGSKIDFLVIGMGLNVRQKSFDHQGATSLHREDLTLDKYQLLEEILIQFECIITLLKQNLFEEIIEGYYSKLRWMGENHKFMVGNLEISGVIIGIDERGRLRVLSDSEEYKYDIKEIKFLS